MRLRLGVALGVAASLGVNLRVPSRRPLHAVLGHPWLATWSTSAHHGLPALGTEVLTRLRLAPHLLRHAHLRRRATTAHMRRTRLRLHDVR